jgi:integrase
MSPLNNQNPNFKYERVGEVVNIFQRGQTWYANYQYGGKQHRPSLRTSSKKEARRRAIQLEADILAGRYQERIQTPTIDHVILCYQAYLQTEGRAPKTLSKIKLVCDRVQDLAARRKAKSILAIDLAFIDQYRSERAANQAAPKTLQNETVIIRQLVNFAKRRKMIVSDPLHGLKIKKVKATRQPCWSWDLVNQILQGTLGPHHNILMLLADTGMRIGEAKWLTWDDIDLVNNIIHIRVKDGWKPKNGEERAVPMSPRVHDMLSQHPRGRRWVFTAAPSKKYPAGDHQISERRLLQYLKRVLKQLGLSGHLHTFRHAFVSHALSSGTPEVVVREWVGHLDKNVLKLYTHIASETSQKAMERLNGLQEPPANKEEPSN